MKDLTTGNIKYHKRMKEGADKGTSDHYCFRRGGDRSKTMVVMARRQLADDIFDAGVHTGGTSDGAGFIDVDMACLQCRRRAMGRQILGTKSI